MLTKIARQDCFDQYSILPWTSYDEEADEQHFFYPKVYSYYKLVLPARSFRGMATALGREVVKLTKQLQIPALIFLGDNDLPWLNQEHDYKPVREARQYLLDHKVGKHFNGGLQVDRLELAAFVKHLAWRTRCCTALPNFHFVDVSENFVGYVCKYGNLHIDAMNQHSDELLTTFVHDSKFEYLDSNRCYSQFDKTSAIPGRQTIV